MVRRVLLSVSLLLGVVALSGLAAPASARGEEQDKVRIRKVEVLGLKRIPAETVLLASGLSDGMELEPSVLPSAARDAVRKVFATGYFSDMNIYSREVEPGVVDLTLVVLEKLVIKKINLVGNDEIEEEDIKKAFSVKEGRFLDSGQLVTTLRSIEELYQDKGFYLAEASYEVEKDEETRTAVVTVKVKEQAEVAVRDINFVGNQQVTDEEIKSIMVTREKGYLSFLEKGGLFLRYFFQLERDVPRGDLPSGFVDEVGAQQFESWSAHQDVDLQRVKWFYLTKGFVEAKLGQPRIALTPDKAGIAVTIDVQEGRWYNVGAVDVVTEDSDGLLHDPAELKAALTLKTGDRFNAQNVMADTDQITRRYTNKGYAFVSVSNSHQLDREKGILDLTYIVEKGRPTYISSIEVTGNKTTADKVVRRELKVAEGELYNQEKIDRSKAMVYRLGFFESVEISHEPAVPSEGVRELRKGEDVEFVDLLVKVKERDTGIFQVGAGFSSLENYIFQARVSKNNFLGRGQTLSFQALVSSLRSIYIVSFLDPYFLDTNWSFSFDLYDTATDFEAFTTETLGGNVSWGYRFFDDYFVYLTYKLEELDTRLGGRLGFTGVPIELLESDGITTSLRLSVAWDTRNNRIIPTEGFYHSASLEWASPLLGGETDFYRSTLNSRYYQPLFWDFVLRLNGTLGHITTAEEKGIPIFERYFVGGIFSVRGFRRNSLSPTIPAAAERDPASSLVPFPMGGNKELILNAEIEVPIFREMGIVGVLFFDAGNAFAESEALSPMDLRTATGFGFRWWSPMGPLRFEWGFPLNPLPGEDPMVFEFTIGSAF